MQMKKTQEGDLFAYAAAKMDSQVEALFASYVAEQMNVDSK